MKTKHAQQIRAGVALALLYKQARRGRNLQVVLWTARESQSLPYLGLKAFQRQREKK